MDITDPQEEEEEEEIYAFKYGADWPEALTIIGSTMLGGRPINQTLGPKQQHKILIAAAQYRAPTPRRAGKGKPLPASEYEGEQETTQRKSTQKQCTRLILPKTSHESSDAFLRRLDTHKNAPESLVAPMLPPEDENMFAKRCIATKEAWNDGELPNVLILPKSAKEMIPEFEERLTVAKKTGCLVFPRGAHETNAHFRARMNIAKASKRVILPKSQEEPEKGFHMRIDMQIACEFVVHPFDPEREDEALYFRRLQAHKDRTGLSFEPGDEKAIEAAIGVEHVHKELVYNPKAAAKEEAPGTADVIAEQMDAAAKKRAKEQEEEEARLKKVQDEKNAAEEENRRVQERIADMKKKQEELHAQEELEKMKHHSFEMEQICLKTIGFMPLKKLLMERGVPKDEVFSCANKFQLCEIAKKHADEMKIQWMED